jgi:hypothetical protein
VKKSNEYARALGPLLAAAPKTVLAAVLVSFVQKDFGSPALDYEVRDAVLKEWETLYRNGIVPQRPAMAKAEGGAA